MGSKNSNGRKTLALLAATATLAGGLTAGTAYAGGGGGDQGGTGGSGSAAQFWQYKDDASGSWGSATDLGSVSRAMAAAGVRMDDSSGKAKAALDAANVECVNGFHQRHPGEGDGDCRVVAVGAASGNGSTTSVWNGSGVYDAKIWKDNWNKNVAPNTYKYAGTYAYKTSTPFDDDPSNSVDKIMERHVDSTRSIVVIVLDKYQPAPANYDLTVTTNQQMNANVTVGSTDAVTDTIHASRNGSTISESVNANVILHYNGHPDGYVAAASATKSVSVANDGDTQSPSFTPADLGMTHWQKGDYWFDIQIAKQGRMNNAVDTTDQEASELFHVPDVPPAPPTKTIDKGTSASQMVNRTVITSGTGRGGYAMRFKDTITPNGVAYEISNYRLVDKSGNDRDVAGEFQIEWNRKDNTVTAVRTADKGEMPLDHEYEFSFDVTVSKPDFKKVKDQATVMWNKTEQSTDEHEFPTWKPNPDKSWIRRGADGKWAAVVDPGRTNATGADDQKFLDGDQVASVVNGTIAADLVQAPKKVELKDDWKNADYIFDATDDVKKIRVYQADAATETQTSVSDIVNKGEDVTDRFDITLKGTTVTATAKASYLKSLKGLKSARQITLLIPGETNFANGKGAAQVRKDQGVAEGGEVTFCTSSKDGKELTNSGSETVNDHETATNEPKICGYVPPVKKDVVSEASQGGDQESVQGKIVFPGQKVEYRLDTQPQLPSDLAYEITTVKVTDTYDQYLLPDRQTLEVTDLNTGKTISKKKYTTKWDEKAHSFQLAFDGDYVAENWKAGTNPRVLVRFEGTVSDKAPTNVKVANQWGLTLNNMIVPSNEVYNVPPSFTPKKDDTQSSTQGDPTVVIDGKTLLKGDTGNYTVTLDASQLKKDDTAYRIQRLGMIDDYDEEYVSIDPDKIEVLDANGRDVTGKLNVQVKDGVVYAFFRTVDTELNDGTTAKGDPQPDDLQEYSTRKLDPAKDPSIDQNVLGQKYTIVMPYTVIKAEDGVTVRNKAIQISNDISKETNEVSNPLKPINPVKDVTVKVGGASVNGRSVYLGRTFLYQLDSSVLPADRAYPQVDQWRITDPLDTVHDQYTGQWAVYATTDLYKDGEIVAAKGDKIAGSGFDGSKFGGDLFTATADDQGVVTVEASELYRGLVSADTAHESSWRAYIQCKRTAIAERVENKFTEQYNDKAMESNVVWTRTPDMTPSLHLEKYDVKSGEKLGDRDDVANALKMTGDSLEIAFKITNTSKVDSSTGEGAWFQAKDLKLTDDTIAGIGKVEDIKYPDNWNELVLKPGESVTVTGTLKGVTDGGKHTDRAKVAGTPLVSCPVADQFGDQQQNGTDTDTDGDQTVDGDADNTDGLKQVTIGDKTLCEDTTVESNTDDWSGYRVNLAKTGAAIGGAVLAVLALASTGIAIITARRRKDDAPAHAA